MSADETCWNIARQQAGTISYRQAQAAGLTASQIKTRRRRGELLPVLPQVSRYASVANTWEQDAWAAVLWGPDAALSHRAAARWHGVKAFGSATPIEISIRVRSRGSKPRLPSLRELVVHRVDEKVEPEVQELKRMKVTSPRRTFLDLAAIKDHRVGRALHDFLRLELTDVGQIWLLLERDWMRGRRGVRIARELLRPMSGNRPTDSDMEAALSDLLVVDGFPRPTHQHPVQLATRTVRLDLSYPPIRLAIEADDYTWHGDQVAFERDRARDAEMMALGWTVVRVTWAQIRYSPDETVARIRRIYGARLASAS